MTIQEITLGNCASTTKTVTETDVYLFAGITGDLNPAHTNEVSASQTPFGGITVAIPWMTISSR